MLCQVHKEAPIITQQNYPNYKCYSTSKAMSIWIRKDSEGPLTRMNLYRNELYEISGFKAPSIFSSSCNSSCCRCSWQKLPDLLHTFWALISNKKRSHDYTDLFDLLYRWIRGFSHISTCPNCMFQILQVVSIKHAQWTTKLHIECRFEILHRNTYNILHAILIILWSFMITYYIKKRKK